MVIYWKPYEREANHCYLDEGQTANEVIQLLLGKYNLVVTYVFRSAHHKIRLNLTPTQTQIVQSKVRWLQEDQFQRMEHPHKL
jgi:hypothetical protein